MAGFSLVLQYNINTKVVKILGRGSEMPSEALRETGIGMIGQVRWGTHFCQFYQTKQDLVDILVPYFKTGLENNEFCMWITAEPLSAAEAKEAMAVAMPDFAQRLARKQIEIIPYTEWYLKGGSFDSRRVLGGWVEKLDRALAGGYAGLRLTGNTLWLEKKDWRGFTEYEAEINNVIGQYRMLALCTYCLDRCNAHEIIDVVRNHEFALIKQEGKWEIIENSTYKKTKEVLAESQHDLNRAQAVAHVGSWRLDVQNDELVWSDETHRIFGIAEVTPMTYETFLAAVHPDDRAYVDREWAAALCGGPYDIEHRIVVGDKIKWVRERAELEFDAQGVLKGGFGTVQDITGLKLAEARQDHLASFPEINPSPVIELDLAGNIAYMNPATQALFPDMPALGIRHPFLKGCAGLAETLPVGKSEMINRELEVAGHWYEQSIFYVPINKSIRLYCRDITERKKVEQLKDEFIGLVSHELRTPLTVIAGCLSTVLTERERLPEDEVQQLLRDAVAETESLSHLVENLLELSRYQAQQLALYAEPVNLPSLVKKTVAKVKRQAPARQFTVSVPPGLPALEADPLRVERILYNLLENAAKYSPSGSRIRVTARAEPGRIVVAVKDQGSGLSASDQARLFTPFERLEQGTLNVIRGAGLGLIVCRSLVEAHGGEIWVESRKGRGSTFFFSLPVKTPGQAAEDKG
jgi:signal transduction histidine kinase